MGFCLAGGIFIRNDNALLYDSTHVTIYVQMEHTISSIIDQCTEETDIMLLY